MSEVLLKAENVSIVFGGLKAVSDFDFYINKGELIGLDLMVRAKPRLSI